MPAGTTKVGSFGYVAQVDENGNVLAGGSSATTGGAANGAAPSGNPVLVAGSDGTAVRTARALANGALTVGITDAAGTAVTLRNGSAGADNTSNATNTVSVTSYGSLWDNTQWVRARGDVVAAFSKAPPLAHTASGIVAASTTSQLLFAANASRTRLLIQNQDLAINIFVNLGAAATAAPPSLRIAPGATLELVGTNASVSVIAASGTPPIVAWQF